MKFGFQAWYSSRLTLDFFTGVGLRLHWAKVNTPRPLTPPNGSVEVTGIGDYYTDPFRSGTTPATSVHIPLTFRVGYLF